MWQSGLTGLRARGGGGGKISPERRAQMRKLMGAPIPGLQAFGRTTETVCLLGATLAEWVRGLKAVVASRPDEQQRKLFHDNAVRVYAL